jgi:hypothetical protein
MGATGSGVASAAEGWARCTSRSTWPCSASRRYKVLRPEQQGGSLLAYAASYSGISSTSDVMALDYSEGATQLLDAPPGGAVVVVLGLETLGTSSPDRPEPSGFESPPRIDGLAFFDTGMSAPLPASFSFASFDRGDNLTAFVTLKPLWRLSALATFSGRYAQ